MDNKMNTIDAALDQEFNTPKVVEDNNNKPRAFVVWKIGDKEYKLKLTAAWIVRLEEQFGQSLMLAITEDGIPSLNVVLPVLQAALQKFNHGIKSTDVSGMYDDYIDSGKTIIDLLGETIYPLLYDAGFFTKATLDVMTEQMKTLDGAL